MRELYILLENNYYVRIQRNSTEFVEVSAFHNKTKIGQIVNCKTVEGGCRQLHALLILKVDHV